MKGLSRRQPGGATMHGPLSRTRQKVAPPRPTAEVAMSSTVQTATDIRPFHVDTLDEKLAELHRRISTTRWPTRELVHDRSQGVQLAMLQQLARYWTTEYDWRKAEAKLNALPQFT